LGSRQQLLVQTRGGSRSSTDASPSSASGSLDGHDAFSLNSETGIQAINKIDVLKYWETTWGTSEVSAALGVGSNEKNNHEAAKDQEPTNDIYYKLQHWKCVNLSSEMGSSLVLGLALLRLLCFFLLESLVDYLDTEGFLFQAKQTANLLRMPPLHLIDMEISFS